MMIFDKPSISITVATHLNNLLFFQLLGWQFVSHCWPCKNSFLQSVQKILSRENAISNSIIIVHKSVISLSLEWAIAIDHEQFVFH